LAKCGDLTAPITLILTIVCVGLATIAQTPIGLIVVLVVAVFAALNAAVAADGVKGAVPGAVVAAVTLFAVLDKTITAAGGFAGVGAGIGIVIIAVVAGLGNAEESVAAGVTTGEVIGVGVLDGVSIGSQEVDRGGSTPVSTAPTANAEPINPDLF